MRPAGGVRKELGDFRTNVRFVDCRLWLNALPGAEPDMMEVWKRYTEYVTKSPPRFREFNALSGRMIVALAAVRAGLPDSARRLVAASMGDSVVDPSRQLIYLAAIVHTQLGDKDKAIELLSSLLRAVPSQRTTLARDRSAWFRDLCSDPRYQTLVRRPAR